MYVIVGDVEVRVDVQSFAKDLPARHTNQAKLISRTLRNALDDTFSRYMPTVVVCELLVPAE